MINWFKKKTFTRIYMDHAATTPIDGEVFRAMEDVYKNHYFNPGGIYQEGVTTEKIIADTRKTVAKFLGTTSEHIVFTRGGTESNNMAIMGVLSRPLREAPSLKEREVPHVITSEIEHPAVLETLKGLERQNKIELSIIPIDREGVVIVDEIKKALKPETVLISIMYVNNEIGIVQPVKEITKLVRWFKKQNNLTTYPLVHTDAIQAANYLDINGERLGVDLMSLSGSKIYGPKSSGCLYIRNKELVSPMFYGGSQEFGLRAGTEDIAQIVGFAKALEKTRSISESENIRLSELQKYFFTELEKQIPKLKINGAYLPLLEGADTAKLCGGSTRICNNINISIPHMSSERLIIELDAKGIAASSKSACREQDDEESHVIKALRKNMSSHGSIRFTMGRSTTKADVIRVVGELGNIVSKIKEFEKGLID